jgi:DNA-binding NarL/FixJ family response regulator
MAHSPSISSSTTAASAGTSSAEIAVLFVSEETVKTHVGKVFAKLGLRDRAQAVVMAYETGLVSPSAG